MKILCIYENNTIAYTSDKINPLAYNVVKGFNDLGLRYFNSDLKKVVYGNEIISVYNGESGIIVFCIDKIERDLKNIYDLYIDQKNSDINYIEKLG